MLKCTGLYGTPDKVAADVHAIVIPDTDAAFKRAVDRLLPAMKATLADLRAKGDFSGRVDEVLPIVQGEARYVLVGMGDPEVLGLETLRRAAAKAMKAAAGFTGGVVALYLPAEEMTKRRHLAIEDVVEAMVEGAQLGHFTFDKYKSNDASAKKGKFKELRIVSADEGVQSRLKAGIETALAVVEGVLLARTLTSTPPNDMSADALAREAQAIAKKYQLKITVLGRKEAELHKLHGLLAVNRGSSKEPRFIILEYNATRRRIPSYVLVGKGVTFDSGGLSIKPAASMEEMKMDMAGAAAVLGVMHTAAKLKLPVRLTALIPATDNLPGGDALCPGDIITYANGKSVEVLNTDAEGRLILADALIYAQRYKPDGIIDLATLTGAVVVALASHATGMMGTSDVIKAKLREAGERTFERVWELPLYDEYDKMLKSQVADLKNIGGRWGGAITAAAFLKAFVGDTPWVHLDIAGTAMLDEATDYAPKGGSGVGVRLLTSFLRAHPATKE